MIKKFLTKKFISIVVLVVLLGSVLFQVVHVNAQTAGVLDHVQINPPSAAVVVNGTQQFTAQGYDSNNVAIPGLTYSWSAIAGGGTINNTGFFTAGGVSGTYNNTVEVIVFQGNITLAAFATVNIFPAVGQLDHVSITPSSVTMVVTGTQQFSAQGYDSNNVAVPNLVYSWSVVAGGGNISATGLFTALTPGTFTNTIQVQTIQGNITRSALASVTISASPGPLDHVLITPSSASLVMGGTQQFSAQAFDSGNTAIPNLTYIWSMIGGGGTINGTGFFTAGSIAGTFTNNIQVTVTQGNVTRANFASVTVTTTPASSTTTTSALTTNKLISLVNSSLKNVGFENLLSAQWTVQQNSSILNVNIVPGVVTAVSTSSLTLQPNGQQSAATFNITSAIIQPNGTQLQLNDKVIVVNVNGQTNIVLKVNPTVTSTASTRLPPGLAKKENAQNNNGHQPPGWSKGKKTGWDKNESRNSSGNED